MTTDPAPTDEPDATIHIEGRSWWMNPAQGYYIAGDYDPETMIIERCHYQDGAA
jgi:hypothetical protein